MNKKLSLFIVIITALLVGCGTSGKEQKKTIQTYVLKPEAVNKNLYFTGIIQPLKESTLTSPIDAVVETMHVHYGQQVKKGDLIFTLNSSELQRQYNEALTEYLKAKDNYTVAQAKFNGTQDLWDAGLMSKNNFLSEKSSLATARVSLLQATRKLSEMLEKLDDKKITDFSSLTLTKFEQVNQALVSRHNLIHIKAPSDGVLLYPPKSSEEKTNKLTVGSAVKSGQVLALVGDLSGISVDIDIPEIDIDKIHTGMPATITGVALGKQVLKGKVVAVNAQASSNSGNGLPSFSAIVEVKALSALQRSWIKVGMSASIEITTDTDNQLLVPIAAIKQEKGSAVVKLKTKEGAIESRVVATGPAQVDKVVIAAGLKPGDVVAYD